MSRRSRAWSRRSSRTSSWAARHWWRTYKYPDPRAAAITSSAKVAAVHGRRRTHRTRDRTARSGKSITRSNRRLLGGDVVWRETGDTVRSRVRAETGVRMSSGTNRPGREFAGQARLRPGRGRSRERPGQSVSSKLLVCFPSLRVTLKPDFSLSAYLGGIFM